MTNTCNLANYLSQFHLYSLLCCSQAAYYTLSPPSPPSPHGAADFSRGQNSSSSSSSGNPPGGPSVSPSTSSTTRPPLAPPPQAGRSQVVQGEGATDPLPPPSLVQQQAGLEIQRYVFWCVCVTSLRIYYGSFFPTLFSYFTSISNSNYLYKKGRKK